MEVTRALRIGSKVNNSTSGSLLYIDATLKLAEDNANLFYDSINSRLGIGETTPLSDIHITKADPEVRLENTGDSNNTRLTRSDTGATAQRFNTARKEGGVGNGLNFDGVNDSIETALNIFTTSDFSDGGTMLCWFKGDVPNPGRTSAIISIEGALHLAYTSTGLFGASLLNRTNLIVSPIDIVDDAFHLIAVTWDGAESHNMILYVDGSSVETGSQLLFNIDSVSRTLRIAGHPTTTLFGKGLVDEVAIWKNRELTGDDISDLWNSGNGLRIDPASTFPTSETSMGTNIGLLYHFDESEMDTAPGGKDAEDSSGNGFHGTAIGSMTDDDFVTAIIPTVGADEEITVWKSIDGTNADEAGIQTFGDVDGRTILEGKTIRLNIGGSEVIHIDEIGVLHFKETITPTAIENYGAVYTKTNNELFFQDGAGVEHLIHGDAFSNLWFHGASTSVTISTQNAFAKITIFENVGDQDDLGNVVGNATNDEITISAGAGASYDITFHVSITAAGANREMIIVTGIELATPLDITNVTDNGVSPIVITSTAHGMLNGDMVQIADVVGNTAANGSFMVANKTADTFEIVILGGGATTGNGDYNEGSPTGDITIKYPGNLVMHRDVSQTSLGVGGVDSDAGLKDGDKVALYVANLDAASNLNMLVANLKISREGD